MVVAQHTGVNNYLSTALGSLIEHIVKKVLKSTETIAYITEAVIDNYRLIAPTSIFVKLKNCRCENKRAKIKECCLQYVETGIKIHTVVVSNASRIVLKAPAYIFDDIKTDPRS